MIDVNKFDAVLDMNDPDFAEKFIEAIGAKPGEEIEIVTPTFDRTDGKAISYFPKALEEYAALRLMSKETLQKLGCQTWEITDDGVHWLYPAEWYDSIPDGLMVTSISGDAKEFKKGVTDDDRRFGALSFGFIQ